jgi:hypothetical protein
VVSSEISTFAHFVCDLHKIREFRIKKMAQTAVLDPKKDIQNRSQPCVEPGGKG